MKHLLGDYQFSTPDAWRDQSTYAFDSPDGEASLLLQLASEFADAPSMLAAARTRYEQVVEPLLIYSNAITAARGDGTRVPAAEGEERDMNGGPKNQRFAMAALVSGRCKMLLLYTSPSYPDFLKFFRQVVGTIVFVSDTLPPATPSGWVRRQASGVLFALPAEWREPSTLSFVDAVSDSVGVRVTTLDPSVPEGSIQLKAELPGAFHTLESSTAKVTQPDTSGWTGEWLVARGTETGPRVVVRKASLSRAGGVTVTLYGKCPEALRAPLDLGWNMVRSTLRRAEGT